MNDSRDFLQMPLFDEASQQTTASGGDLNEFIKKTFTFLEVSTCILLTSLPNSQENKNEDIVSWTPDGESFQIKDTQRFAETVLPQAFRHNNLDSFIRQVLLLSTMILILIQFVASHVQFQKEEYTRLQRSYLSSPIFQEGPKVINSSFCRWFVYTLMGLGIYYPRYIVKKSMKAQKRILKKEMGSIGATLKISSLRSKKLLDKTNQTQIWPG